MLVRFHAHSFMPAGCAATGRIMHQFVIRASYEDINYG